MHPDAPAILALLLTPGIGLATARRAVAAAEILGIPLDALLACSSKGAMECLPAGLQDLATPLATCGAPQRFQARELMQRLRAIDAYVLCEADPLYPASLRAALQNAAPPLLFCAGSSSLFRKPAAAIAGTCDPSMEGLSLARDCAAAFASEGVVVVSGGARGIDSGAHQGALAAGGATIVVLPQGILTYRAPHDIAAAVAEGRALLCSGFPPAANWETHAAVTRNAAIAGLARLACVIEPRRIGGSICTGEHALAQGKRLMVHPARGFEGIAAILDSPRTFPLLECEGHFNKAYLLAHWRNAPECVDPAPLLF